MGFEDEVDQSFGRPCRQSDGRYQADMRTHLIHRPARDIIPPLGGARVSSYRLISHDCRAVAVACSRVQRNSVPSTQMRCRITASRRASATIAFFIPRRLAICIGRIPSKRPQELLSLLGTPSPQFFDHGGQPRHAGDAGGCSSEGRCCLQGGPQTLIADAGFNGSHRGPHRVPVSISDSQAGSERNAHELRGAATIR